MKNRQASKCFGCLKDFEGGYCNSCLKRLFDGKKTRHILPFSKPEYERTKLAQAGRISISGVQTKHSLRRNGKVLELTDHDGGYILKPVPHGSFENLAEMPANEHLTMQMARQIFKLETAANALILFSDGEPAYLTKRFDRGPDGTMYLQEDFAQIAERTSDSHGEDYKYGLSYEEIGDLMRRYVGPYAIEAEKLFKLVLFNYLVHNGDAHLKNFSLIRYRDLDAYILTPAYDLANTRIHLPNESDMALDLFKGDFSTASFQANAYFAMDDFIEFGKKLGIKDLRITAAMERFCAQGNAVKEMIARSYLKTGTKKRYGELISDRIKRLSYSYLKGKKTAKPPKKARA